MTKTVGGNTRAHTYIGAHTLTAYILVRLVSPPGSSPRPPPPPRPTTPVTSARDSHSRPSVLTRRGPRRRSYNIILLLLVSNTYIYIYIFISCFFPFPAIRSFSLTRFSSPPPRRLENRNNNNNNNTRGGEGNVASHRAIIKLSRDFLLFFFFFFFYTLSFRVRSSTVPVGTYV